EHRAHLADDFPCGEIAFHSQERRQTELAVDGTPYLARNANRRAVPSANPSLGFIPRLAAITRLALVSFGHPNSLNTLSIPKLDEVPDRSVDRPELLLSPGLADSDAPFGKKAAHGCGKGRDLFQIRYPLAVDSLKQLAHSVGRFPGLLDDCAQFLGIQTQ